MTITTIDDDGVFILFDDDDYQSVLELNRRVNK